MKDEIRQRLEEDFGAELAAEDLDRVADALEKASSGDELEQAPSSEIRLRRAIRGRPRPSRWRWVAAAVALVSFSLIWQSSRPGASEAKPDEQVSAEEPAASPTDWLFALPDEAFRPKPETRKKSAKTQAPPLRYDLATLSAANKETTILLVKLDD